jgi:mono/diheme cytochrome c family protein
MHRYLLKSPLLTGLLCFVLVACGNENKATQPSVVNIDKKEITTGRWYSQQQADSGSVIFSNHCAECHGQNAQATSNWKTPNADGQYPPPPLDGSAHAWHHPLSVLSQIILEGGGAYDGQMPAWKGTLSETEVYAAIASFQEYWSDETYEGWLTMNKQSRQ